MLGMAARMTTPELKSRCCNQVVLLRRLDHPNIIGYYTSFVEKKNLHIVMEYAPNGDLQAVGFTP